jgi:hypothetical protein
MLGKRLFSPRCDKTNSSELFCRFIILPLIAGFFLLPNAALGQTPAVANYPLQIILPRSAASSPDAGAPSISSNHRIFWAYPGVPYNIRGAVVGGAFPYTYSLESAPSGMTINAVTGEINWPDPRTDAHGITFKVTDAAGTQASTTWSIDVNSARFIFLSASSPSGGDGTLANPFRQISDIPAATHVGKIVYFMSGTYQVLDMARVTRTGDSSWERVEFSGSTKPLSWLEYPGQSALIDFGWKGSEVVPLIRLSNGPIYLDGFETANSHNMAFQFGSANFAVVRRMNMHHQGPGQDGANSAFLMFLSNYGSPAIGTVIQDNTFSGITYGTGNCALKMYSLNKSLVEDNVFHSTDAGTEAIVAIKSDNPRFTVRRNTFYDIRTPAIGGNMHMINHATYGEILYNNVRAGTSAALFINQDGQAARIDVFRNTLSGRVWVRNTDAGDGPFNLYNNVIVSSDPAGRWVSGSRIHFENVTDASRVTMTNNLEGSPSENIIDSSGNLTATYASYLGTRGWQVPSTNTPPPRLESPKMRPNGSFQFRLTNAPAANHVIRASTDLIQWLPVATNQASNGGLDWEDSDASRYRFRFYHVLSP